MRRREKQEKGKEKMKRTMTTRQYSSFFFLLLLLLLSYANRLQMRWSSAFICSYDCRSDDDRRNKKIYKCVTPEQGLEPWTLWLKATRSTDWATRATLIQGQNHLIFCFFSSKDPLKIWKNVFVYLKF